MAFCAMGDICPFMGGWAVPSILRFTGLLRPVYEFSCLVCQYPRKLVKSICFNRQVDITDQLTAGGNAWEKYS